MLSKQSSARLFAGGVVACAYGWGVAFYGVDDGSGELGAEGFVVGAVEVGAEVFAGGAVGEVAA